MEIKNMKTSYYLVALGAIALCNTANGDSAPKRFTGEIKSGLDIVSA